MCSSPADGASGSCPLCRAAAASAERDPAGLAAVVADAWPSSPGHLLVVPLRHVADFFDLTEEETGACLRLLRAAARTLRRTHAPAGLNVGVNVGAAAGQTIAHVHVHLIPRYAGDATDPRGGVRWVLPSTAAYWER